MAARAGGLHAAQPLWPSGGLRFKSPGVSRGAKALRGDTWVQTGWKWLEAPQRLQLVPHWGTGFRRATPREIGGRSFEGAKAPHLPHRAGRPVLVRADLGVLAPSP